MSLKSKNFGLTELEKEEDASIRWKLTVSSQVKNACITLCSSFLQEMVAATRTKVGTVQRIAVMFTGCVIPPDSPKRKRWISLRSLIEGDNPC